MRNTSQPCIVGMIAAAGSVNMSTCYIHHRGNTHHQRYISPSVRKTRVGSHRQSSQPATTGKSSTSMLATGKVLVGLSTIVLLFCWVWRKVSRRKGFSWFSRRYLTIVGCYFWNHRPSFDLFLELRLRYYLPTARLYLARMIDGII